MCLLVGSPEGVVDHDLPVEILSLRPPGLPQGDVHQVLGVDLTSLVSVLGTGIAAKKIKYISGLPLQTF